MLTARVALVVAVLSGLPGCSTPASPTATPAEVTRLDVTIPGSVTIGGALYRPAVPAGEARPGLVVIHGHLPYGTSGAATVEGIARRYANRGYVAFAMSMRGWPPSGGVDDCALEQPDDVVRAVAWLRATSGVDAAHVGLMGYSKGGQMALLAASRDAGAQAVVAYYPPTDLALWKVTTENPDTVTYITLLCEPPPGLQPRSPVGHAASITSPVLLVHGDADTRVPLQQSQVMAEALRAAGRQVELLVVPGPATGSRCPNSRWRTRSWTPSSRHDWRSGRKRGVGPYRTLVEAG